MTSNKQLTSYGVTLKLTDLFHISHLNANFSLYKCLNLERALCIMKIWLVVEGGPDRTGQDRLGTCTLL